MLKKAPTASAIRAANRNAVGGGPKRCRKGKNCSATCIDPNKDCLVGLPEPVSVATTKVAKMLQERQGQGGGVVASPATTPEQPTEIVSQAKKEGAYAPREVKKVTGAKAEISERDMYQTDHLFKPESYDEKIEVMKGRGWLYSKEKIDENVKILELQKQQAQQNKKFLENLEKNVPEGTKITLHNGTVVITSKTKSGDTVQSEFSPKGGYNFRVNDTMATGSVKDRRAQMEVAFTVRNQFDALVRSLPVGHIVETSAYGQDGKAEGRESAYQRVGFSKPDKLGGKMFAVKQADGSMAPGTPESSGGTKEWTDQENKPDGVWFSENERTSRKQEIINWYEIITGDRLKK